VRKALELGAGVGMRNKERRIAGENTGGGSKWQGKRKQENADEYIHILSFYRRLIWLYIVHLSRPGHWLEVSGQLHAPAALLSATEPPVPIECGPQSRSELYGESHGTRPVHPVARRYNDVNMV
jgi:hypothetical protein